MEVEIIGRMCVFNLRNYQAVGYDFKILMFFEPRK